MSENSRNPDFVLILETVEGMILKELNEAWAEGKTGYRVTFTLHHDSENHPDNRQVEVNTETKTLTPSDQSEGDQTEWLM